MKRIESTFVKLKKEGKKALITFVTAGDPSLQGTKSLVKIMVEKGADIIELGVPYSDPIAEGPVIQAANIRALAQKVKVSDMMKAVKELRQEGVTVPILYLLYYNVVLQYGLERFCEECAASGVDGLIVPDLPFEEQDELRPFCEKNSVDLITLVSPVSEERIAKIVQGATGFIYCVSSLGVTGVRSGFKTDFTAFFKKLNECSKLPKAIGFGISTPEQIQELKGFADGLIVGSAIVSKVAEAKGNELLAQQKVGSFVAELREALN